MLKLTYFKTFLLTKKKLAKGKNSFVNLEKINLQLICFLQDLPH